MTEVSEQMREIPAPERAVPPRRGSRRSASWVGYALLAGVAGAAGAFARSAGGRAPPSFGERMGEVAGEIGRGLVAGMAGTAAITLAGALEQGLRAKPTEAPAGPMPAENTLMRVFHRIHEPWLFAGDAAGKVLGVRPIDAVARRRFAIAGHWLYGTAWGATFGILGVAGVRGVPAAAAVLTGQLTAEFVAMPAAGLFPGPGQWGARAIVSSVLDHAAYAVAAGATFEALHSPKA